jgi:hypothetical protein
MTDKGEERKLRFLGRQTDRVRNTVTEFFIEPPNTPGPRENSGLRHLIARYVSGGASDLRVVDGLPEFATGIPNDWSEQQVMELMVGDLDPVSPKVPETKQ